MAKKTKSVTESTAAPSGLKISRSGNTYTLSWKISAPNYGDGQWFQYFLGYTGNKYWSSVIKLGAKVTSKAITINLNSYYPYTDKYLSYITMRVKGDRKSYTTGSGKKKKTHIPKVSAFSSYRFNLALPSVPSLTATLDEELTNVCTFSWDTSYDGVSANVLSDVEWQTVLIKNSSETDGSKVDWSDAEKGSAAASYSRTITEDTSILYRNGDSYTRWFRVRGRGPRGASAWRYAYHVYALPHQANVLNTSAQETEEGGFLCVVDWEVSSNMQNPIDRTIVQYSINTPDPGLNCPSGASWTDANISRDTEDGDAAVFSIDDQLSKDQCLFIRVNTQYDSHITYGQPQLSSVGFLKDPEDLSVQTNNTTHRATVSASNLSSIEDSVLVVTYVPFDGEPINVGIIPHSSDSITVQCPDWSDQSAIRFEVYAMVGTFTKQTRADNVDSYVINAKMRSEGVLSEGGAVPSAPQNVSVSRVDNKPDTIQVTWDWPWEAANSAELSWSDHDDAWESTDQPESYILSNLHASRWNISGLETGKTWYVRVRLLINSPGNEDATYGPWSDIEQGIIDLSSAPNKPVLLLSDSVISEDGSTTASWVYTSTDNTEQAYAEVAIVENNEYIPIAHTLTNQHITIDANSSVLTTGNIYNLACRVKSASGKISEWSDIVSLTIAEPLVCRITQTSLVNETVETDIQDVERDIMVLKEMPLTVTVTGAGDGGTTIVAIERSKSYHRDTPDENEFYGYENETIAIKSQLGEGQMSFGVDDLIGSFDDGAEYRIVATVKDGLGQTAKTSEIISSGNSYNTFDVNWSHQALVPSAEIIMDEDNLIAQITPIAPEGAISTDVADIYRLSADKPELIVFGAQFGTAYVDPYPALGDMGGYRIVLRTENGDYNTEDNSMAWIDSPELGVNPLENEDELNIIDFNGQQIRFYYDTDYSNTWAKDFEETQYLGGSIQGDWNAAVSRTGTLSSQAITVLDQDMLQAIRRLAEYPGICHVRTADGSSYAADVQVSEDRVHDDREMLVNYSLSITRVDPQEYDGITLAQWEDETAEEEGE